MRRAAAIAALLAVLVAARDVDADDAAADPIRAAQLAASVHRELACSDCHREHGDPVGSCGGCHDAAADALARGGHRDTSLACVDCHGSHDVGGTAPGSRTSRAATAPLCGGCHEDALVAEAAGAHALALAAGDARAPTCSSCHDAHAAVAAPKAAVCGHCHESAEQAWASSVHAGTRGCAACHAPHGEKAARTAGGARTYAGSVARCGACHPGPLDDHVDGLHGVAAELGHPRAPACITCHGAHEVLDEVDPASPVSERRRGEMCGGCHAGAGASFASGAFHHDPSTLGHRAVDWVRAMYLMMIVAVIGGMLLHNGIDFRRRLIDRRKRARPASRATVMRFTVVERIQHWALATSFLTLLFTGLSLRLGWRPVGVSAETWVIWRSWLHRAAAVVFIGLGVAHVAWLFLTARGRVNLAALRPRIRSVRDAACCVGACFYCGPPSRSDWRALVATMKYGLGRAPRRPPQGRFTYAEKMEYYALLWGGLVMTLTGLALWFVTPVLDRAPAWVTNLAAEIHLFEAILAGLAVVVWHFYFTIFRPEVFPLSHAMVSGRIPVHEAEEEHGLEHESQDE